MEEELITILSRNKYKEQPPFPLGEGRGEAPHSCMCTFEIPDAAALAKLDAAYAAASRPVWEDLLTRYRIIKDTPLAFFPGKDEECSTLYGQLMEAYLEHPDPSRADIAMECYLYEWRDIDSDFSDMPDTLWAKSVVARWQKEEDPFTHTW